ncbi:MAG: family 20 glycosylhydrolase [Spirochaetes bacterium]|nr:family 20 glycosylhydrolase [Spirochaetota bacterium]
MHHRTPHPRPNHPLRIAPLLALLFVAPAFPAFVEAGMTTVEAMVESAAVHIGPEVVVVAADFYTATAQWANLFPRKGATSKFEKKGPVLDLLLKDSLSNVATHRYVARSNGARMELEAVFAPSDVASIAVWDVFLSKDLFGQATVKRPGQSDLVLDTNRFDTLEAEDLTLRTALGDWRFVLTADHGVKWKLRSVCDRKWGPPQKQTFSLLYQKEGMPPEGMKLKLAVDIEFTPKPGAIAVLQKRGDNRAADYFRALNQRYGSPIAPAKNSELPALATAAAKQAAFLNEDRTDPRVPTVIPLPKKMATGKGAFPFRAGVPVMAAQEGPFSLLSEDLAARGVHVERVGAPPASGVLLGLVGDAAALAAARGAGLDLGGLAGKKESYALSVKPGAIVVVGADLAGLVHGVQSLRQLIRNGASGLEAPSVEILDSPDLAFRGFYLEGAGSIVGTDDFRRLVRDTYSRFHANAVVAEIRWYHLQWKSHPEIAGPKARPLSDLAAAAKEARALGIEFIPAVFSYGKVQDLLKTHPEIAENPDWAKKRGESAWCPNRPETYALFFDLLQELVAATGCTRVHIGHDEIFDMALCPACKAVPAHELFASDVNRIADWLRERKIGTMIWGDFLLENKRWVPLGVTEANSANAQFGGHVVHPAVGKIQKDVVITDWHYGATRDYPSFKHFSDAGYPVIGCPWHLALNNTATARSIGAIRQLGILTTDWGFLGPRAPGANSVLGVTHGWNLAQPDVEGLGWDPDAVLAATLLPQNRPSRAIGAKQIPVDLGAAAQKMLTGDETAWFGQGTRHDLALLPAGEQTFFGSRFRIGTKAAVVGKDLQPTGPIALGRKAKSLVFLHALMVEDLAIGARHYATYRVKRADGSVTNLMVTHRNAAHWLSKTPRKNAWGTFHYAHAWDSLLAWEGATREGEPVNLQAWEWVNPLPNVAITSVELKWEPADPGVKVGLIALTSVE